MTVKDTVKDTAERASAFASDTLAVAGEKLHDASGQLRETAEAARTTASDTLSAAREKVGDAYEGAREKAGSAFETAKEKTAGAYEVAREKTGSVYEGARTYASSAAEATRERANAAYSTARETASSARSRTADGIEDNPIAALIGGIAIGVVLGALLPRSQREMETLAPIGDRLATLARNAIAAAKDAGQDTLDELGINKGAAREQVSRLIDGASKAASSASSAAADAIREPRS